MYSNTNQPTRQYPNNMQPDRRYADNQGCATAASPNNKPNTILLIYSIIITIIAIIVTIVLITNLASTSNNDEEAGIETQVYPAENTPMLKLYASLDEEMTIGILKNAIQENYADAKLTVYNSGYGIVEAPDGKDHIIFSYDLPESVDESDDESDDGLSVFEEEYALSNYDLSTMISDIQYRYLYASEDKEELGASIGYLKEDDIYYVDIIGEDFDFPTKQEAIEAYLSQ